ncbi:MAG: beta-lactamase family protein [Rhodothermaceae bacterium]|nr:beta-lactamase family protein [Rhodothermaceae bacterium]
MITLQRRLFVYIALLCLFSVNGYAQPIDSLLARGEALSPLNSLIISWKGEVVGERYYRGMRSNRVVNVKSVSKSLISPLVGIAIRDSLLEGAHQKLTSLLPEYAQYIEESHRDEILLHHVLSMTTGLEGTSFQNYGPWVASSDWVKFALSQPSACPPASCMTYSTGNSHLVSVILSRASGKDLRTYARDVFFRPLGISLPNWDRDPQGYYLGGNNMGLRPRDMLKIGELFRNKGQYGDRQIVPASWIDRMWETYTISPWNGHRHGYYWWNRTFGGEKTHFAWGYGGQYIFIVPRLELVVVVTSSLSGRRRGENHNRIVQDFLAYEIIPAIRARMNAGNAGE